MRYNKVRKMDISNGPGVRVSIFMQGCTFHCKNCFNPETHDFMGGEEFTEDTIDQVLKLCENANVEGLSILGGEPMHPMNIEGTTELAKKFKEKFEEEYGKNVHVPLTQIIDPSGFNGLELLGRQNENKSKW